MIRNIDHAAVQPSSVTLEKMNIVVNGEPRELAAGATIGEILSEMQLQPEAVVVEVNATILEPRVVSRHQLREGDRIEIIRFVGGG